MNLKMINTGLFCLALTGMAAPAQAQMAWTDRGFVNVNLGVQTGSQTFTVATPFEIYGEPGSVTSTVDAKGGALFDVSAGYKVWRNLALGVGYSRTGKSSDAAVTASVPDPLIFDQFRSVNATAADLSHNENTIYLTGTWMIPVTDKVDVAVAFGPAIFSVKQEIANGVEVTEPGPSVTRVNVGSIDETTVGIHVGVDVTYLITPRWGVGGLARFTRGSVDVDNASEKLDVGGFQVAGGLRVRF